MEPITKCRVCESSHLSFLLGLNDQFVNNFVTPGQEQVGVKYPIKLVLCGKCSLVQMLYTAPQELLYNRFYWYRSGVTDTMQEALRDVALDVGALVNLDDNEVVLDIGSNDGTLLRSYSFPNVVRVGFEPANNLVELGKKGLQTFVHDFWNYDAYNKIVGEPAMAITALGMFYDLEDPNKFIEDVARALHPEGIFVAQLMCLYDMLAQGDVGNLTHEHLEFYSFKSLQFLYQKHGLEIIDIKRNNVNGGSYRIFARHQGAGLQPFHEGPARLKAIEKLEVGLDDPQTYQKFLERIESNKRDVVDFVQHVANQGKTVWVYGASTKGNVVLQYYGLDRNLISGASERSPEKWGKRTIGTGIDIYSEQDARAAKPDYFLVLPYAFINEFKKRESAWYEAGGRFIVPFPEFKVV
jgi:SAM-dependent methyltransferase